MSRPWTEADQVELDRIMLQQKLGLPNAHTGPFPKTTTHAKHQLMCDDCGEYAAMIIWKDDTQNSNTWFFAECDTCEHVFCEDCIDVESDPPICYTCYEEAQRIKQ